MSRYGTASFAERITQLKVSGATVLALNGVDAFRADIRHAAIRCPNHADVHPSCSVDLECGRARCFGCGWRAGDAVALHRTLGGFSTMGDALRDLGLRAASAPELMLLPRLKRGRPSESGTRNQVGVPFVTESWLYRYADGRPAFQVDRVQFKLVSGAWFIEPGKSKPVKEYRCSHPGGIPARLPEPFCDGALRPLYQLPEIVGIDPDLTILVAEGERATDALRGLGYPATTSSGGATNAHLTDWAPLSGRRVVIWPDNDLAGEAYARSVTGILGALVPAATVTWLDISGLDLPVGGDAVDWVAGGGRRVL